MTVCQQVSTQLRTTYVTTLYLYVDYGGSEPRSQAGGFYDFLPLRAHEALRSVGPDERPSWDGRVCRFREREERLGLLILGCFQDPLHFRQALRKTYDRTDELI